MATECFPFLAPGIGRHYGILRLWVSGRSAVARVFVPLAFLIAAVA